jgi:heme o synthase
MSSAIHAVPAAPGTAARARALYEMTKPGITRMVLVTTAAGFYMAAAAPFDFVLLIHALLGTALAASGCNALNQYIERDADALMVRTALRPLPSGRVDAGTAFAFATTITAAGLIHLLVFVNALTALLVLLTLLSYLLAYTPLKRRTWLATIIGAVPGALPILAGWTAAGGGIDGGGLALFGILFAWQMPHFFALAWIYREDYARGGFPLLTVVDPTGRRAGRQVVGWGTALLAASVFPWALGLAGGWYLAGALLGGGIFLLLGTAMAARRSRPAAYRVFWASIVYLPAVLVLMAVFKA